MFSERIPNRSPRGRSLGVLVGFAATALLCGCSNVAFQGAKKNADPPAAPAPDSPVASAQVEAPKGGADTPQATNTRAPASASNTSAATTAPHAGQKLDEAGFNALLAQLKCTNAKVTMETLRDSFLSYRQCVYVSSDPVSGTCSLSASGSMSEGDVILSDGPAEMAWMGCRVNCKESFAHFRDPSGAAYRSHLDITCLALVPESRFHAVPKGAPLKVFPYVVDQSLGSR